MRSALCSLALLLALALATGCGAKGNCEVVVDKTIELVAAEAGSTEAIDAARKKLAADRDEMVKKCQAQDLSKAAEECAVAAKSLADLAGCDSK